MIKRILKKLKIAKESEKNYQEEKEDLSKHKTATEIEKDRRRDSGLAFNSGKNPLKEKTEQVNYRMAKPPAAKVPDGELPQSKIETDKKKESQENEGGEDKNRQQEGKGDSQKAKKKGSLTSGLFLKNAWHAPKIIKTNLAKGEITTFINWKKNINDISVACGVVLGIIAAWYVGLIIMEMGIESQGRLLAGDIDVLKAQVITAQDEVQEIDRFQEKLKYSKVLLNNHVYWTNFFDFFEDNLLPETVITGPLNIESNGMYKFSMVTDSYESMVNQLLILKNQAKVLSAESTGAKQEKTIDSEIGAESNSVYYNVDIILDTSLFRK